MLPPAFPVCIYTVKPHPNRDLAAWKYVSLTIGPLTAPPTFDGCSSRSAVLRDCRAVFTAQDTTVFAIRTLATYLTHLLPLQVLQGAATMNSRYVCAPPCQEQWNKPGPFNRHVKTCRHWRARDKKMQKRRAAAVAAAQPPKKRQKPSPKQVQYLGYFTQ